MIIARTPRPRNSSCPSVLNLAALMQIPSVAARQRTCNQYSSWVRLEIAKSLKDKCGENWKDFFSIHFHCKKNNKKLLKVLKQLNISMADRFLLLKFGRGEAGRKTCGKRRLLLNWRVPTAFTLIIYTVLMDPAISSHYQQPDAVKASLRPVCFL